MNLFELPCEMLINICEYLTDYEKLSFTTTCKHLSYVKELLYFDREIDYRKIEKLPYKYNFTNIKIENSDYLNDLENFKYLKRLTIWNYPGTKYSIHIPNTVKYLRFGDYFNQDIKGILPPFLKYLWLGDEFNKEIKDCFPNTLERLTFGCSFNQKIEGNIPPSVRRITFCGRISNENLKGIPDTITHLSLVRLFNDDLEGLIPKSVTHLTLDFNYTGSLNCLPRTIKHLCIRRLYDESIEIDDFISNIREGIPDYIKSVDIHTM